MTQVLKFPVRKFKITMVNILRILMEKVDKMKDQIDNVSRVMENIRKNQKEIKSTVTEMRNDFDGLIRYNKG